MNSAVDGGEGSAGATARYGVDPGRVLAGAAVCLDVSVALQQAAARVAEVGSDARAWAVDGGLPEVTDRLLSTLRWAAAACAQDARALADRATAAAAAYRAADAAATAPGMY